MEGNGQAKPNGNAQWENEERPARPKRRAARAILKDGLEAALRADPEVMTNCKPKTCAGGIVRALVLGAGKGKMTALKTLMSLLDWEAEEEGEEPQEHSDEPRWDWSDGV